MKKIMKIKSFFFLLFLTFNSAAQDTTTIRNQQVVCQAFWQIFESDSFGFEFQDTAGKVTNFRAITHYLDTMINPLSCDPIDFNVEPYIINHNYFDCTDISKMIFYNDDKRIEKIGFYINVYDNKGNYKHQKVLFWAIY